MRESLFSFFISFLCKFLHALVLYPAVFYSRRFSVISCISGPIDALSPVYLLFALIIFSFFSFHGFQTKKKPKKKELMLAKQLEKEIKTHTKKYTRTYRFPNPFLRNWVNIYIVIGSGFLQTRRQKKGYRKDLTVHFHWPTLQVECLLAVPRRDSVLFFSSFVYRLFLFFKKVGQNKKKRKRNGRDVLRPSEVYNKWTQLFITLSPRSTLYSRCCCCLRARDASHAIYQITIGKKKKKEGREGTRRRRISIHIV